jgi:uncharacterized protein YegP (UPF0339 family)
MTASFKLQKSHEEKFFFNLMAENGERILTSETYNAKESALKGIESVRKNSQSDSEFKRKMSTAGKHFFVLAAANGETIGKSEEYSSKEAMEGGIAAVKIVAPGATITDLA